MPSPGAFLEASEDAVRIRVKVVPGARRDAIAGPLGDHLKVCVAAPPEGGRANRAVAELLATRLGIPAASVSLVRGASSPRKTFELRGCTPEEAGRRLAEVVP